MWLPPRIMLVHLDPLIREGSIYNVPVVASPVLFYQLRRPDGQQINHQIYLKLRRKKIRKEKIHIFNL